MPRFGTQNPPSEPTEPQASLNQKPRRLLKPVLFVIIGLLLISPIAYAEYLSAYTGVPPDIILKIFAQATLTCGGFMEKLCPIGFKCVTKGEVGALGICIPDPPLYWRQLKKGVPVSPAPDREEPEPSPEPPPSKPPEERKPKPSGAELSCQEQTRACKYTSEERQFEFKYPDQWTYKKGGLGVELTNSSGDFRLRVSVWQVTGFGYCYNYGEEKEIQVGGVKAITADGAGGSSTEGPSMCSDEEKYLNMGNTFVLVPFKDQGGSAPFLPKIHFDFDYPLNRKDLAKLTLDQILSTFKFLE